MMPRSCCLARHGWAWGLVLTVLPLAESHAQDPSTPATAPDTLVSPAEPTFTPQMLERNLSGPRFGVTYRPNKNEFASKDVGRFVSQFGWHFETQVVPIGGGPQFVLQLVPLVAGVEYGKFLPSASFGMGVRFPSGYEFGIGPTVSLARDDYEGTRLKSALFIAAGRSFDYGGVSIPVNAVLATNRNGARASLIVGYAIRRASRPVPR